VALKLLHPNLLSQEGGKEIIERFIREARSAAKLEHPNIVHIYDVGDEKGLYYMVMQFIWGETLLEKIKRHGALGMEETLGIIQCVAKGLQEAHSKGIIHRDVKPANILLSKENEVKITDFGLAKQVNDESHLSQVGRVFGTPLYLSPEQALGEQNIDGRADLYSLGVTMFQCLTGSPPYTGNSSFLIMQQHVCALIPSLRHKCPGIKEELEYLVHKLMAKNRNDRFASAEEVVNYIEQVKKAGSLSSASTSDRELYDISFGKIPPTRRMEHHKLENLSTSTRRFHIQRSDEAVHPPEHKTSFREPTETSKSMLTFKEEATPKGRMVLGKGGGECVSSSGAQEPPSAVEGSHAQPEGEKIRIQLGSSGVELQSVSEKDKKGIISEDDFLERDLGKKVETGEKIRIQLGSSGVELQSVSEKDKKGIISEDDFLERDLGKKVETGGKPKVETGGKPRIQPTASAMGMKIASEKGLSVPSPSTKRVEKKQGEVVAKGKSGTEPALTGARAKSGTQPASVRATTPESTKSKAELEKDEVYKKGRTSFIDIILLCLFILFSLLFFGWLLLYSK
jgi:serine/threonine protein kinase